MRDASRATLADGWRDRGHDLGFGIGIAQGYATLGRIGFEGRFDYAAIGSVTNLAARLCAEAEPWQILVTQRVHVGRRGPRRRRRRSATSTCAASAGRSASFDVKGIDTVGEGDAMTTTTARRRWPTLSELDEPERYARFDELQRTDAAASGRRCASNLEDESVVVIPSVTPRPRGRRAAAA